MLAMTEEVELRVFTSKEEAGEYVRRINSSRVAMTDWIRKHNEEVFLNACRRAGCGAA